MLKKSIYYMIVSAMAFTFLNVIVKLLGRFDVAQIVFFRSVGSLIFTFWFLAKHKIAPLGNKKALLVLRGVAGLLSMGLFFAAIKELQLGSAVSLRYTSPIFALIFALLFLKEKIKPIQWLFISIAFLGVLLMKGFDTEVNGIGMIYILGSAIFSGFVFIIIRKIGDRDHPVVVVNYFMIIAAIVSGFFAIYNWKTPIGLDWFFLLSLGVFGYVGQYFMTKAFQIEKTNLVAPLKYLEVIFTMLLGFMWFNEIYSFWTLAGILLVITGLLLNTLLKRN
ncbi:membrane protein [Patiriisocius marinistellae]|uniref:Membrane protein n=1 Tax=Patiriisocius marinistellae TaxID=2494560 RepID=A0A5J4G0A6_9FLAO|nr:DMT family transporter [Patiriisocius marinistellae]GEQ86982.1 membrane protein [Patiriisocius marinistellae]